MRSFRSWSWLAISGLMVVVLVVYRVLSGRQSSPNSDADRIESRLTTALKETNARMVEAQQETAVSIEAARSREHQLKQDLRDVTRMEDPQARRAALLALYQKVIK